MVTMEGLVSLAPPAQLGTGALLRVTTTSGAGPVGQPACAVRVVETEGMGMGAGAMEDCAAMGEEAAGVEAPYDAISAAGVEAEYWLWKYQIHVLVIEKEKGRGKLSVWMLLVESMEDSIKGTAMRGGLSVVATYAETPAASTTALKTNDFMFGNLYVWVTSKDIDCKVQVRVTFDVASK